MLTEDGVNITEDVRDWARGESTVSALAYNISGEAAAEYAASVAVPETDAAATAAAAPGITITPNDPAPLGGMTVMSISYSDLAGVMSFKSVSANKYLTLHPTNLNTLMTYNRILVPYSRWVVSYDVTTGLTIANLYQPANKYLGFDDTDSFIIDPLSYMMDMFTLGIESSTENIVTINCGQIAISSTAALYEKNEDDDYFPTSCQWEIVSKTNYAPVQSITTSRIRTVNAEEPFYAEYTTNPAEPTYSDINLHFASNNQVVPTDSDFDMDDLCAYVITEPGTYQVYYKDVSSGVRSANFWLNVIQNVRGITPASSVRIEQSGVGFDLDYTVLPELANNYSISLYYASNDEEVDYEEDEDGEPDYYYIDTPGDYTVYFKDEVTRIKSPNFTLTVVDHIIIPESDVRIEQKNVGFTLDYTFYPGASTYSNVKLYYADTNTEVPHTGDTYTIPTAGVYSVYYKDSVSGVTSVEFMLIVVDSMEVYESNITYSIRSYITSQNSEDLYLSVNSSTGLELMTKDLNSRTVVRDTGSDTILCERLANISRTFTFKHSVDSCDILSGVYITATMSTSQYTGLPNRSLVESNSYNGNYYLTNKDTIANTIKYIEDSGPSLTTMNQGGTPFVLLDMGDYYLIAIAQYLTSASPVIMALKASGNSMVVEEYTPDSTDANAFKWYIDQIGVDVPLMKQTGSVWCGPTSYLQVLLGKSENVVGNRYNTTLNFQQSTIKATFTDFVEGAGVFIPNQSFANGINNGDYIPEGYVCHELEVTNSVTQDTIYNSITNSLRKGMACMFMTSTGKPPYKQTHNGNGHIICIMGYDPSSNTILISNCHYWDSTDDTYGVFGIFEIDFEDFCEDVGHLWYFTCTEQSEGEQP